MVLFFVPLHLNILLIHFYYYYFILCLFISLPFCLFTTHNHQINNSFVSLWSYRELVKIAIHCSPFAKKTISYTTTIVAYFLVFVVLKLHLYLWC